MRAASLRALAGWVIIAIAVGAFLATRGAAAQVLEPELSTEERARAAAMYANTCSQCHGGDARGGVTVPGTGRQGPPLAGTDEVTIAYVDLVLRTGRMPPAGDPFDNRPRRVAFTDEQRRILVTWMAEEFAIGGEIPEPSGPGDPAHGRAVFAGNCAQCHGSTGAGGVAGAGAYTPQINHLEPIAVAEAIRVGPFEMPAFSEEQISQEELGDVAAFLATIDAEPGTPIGLVELNPVYVSGFAALIVLIIVFGLFWIAGRPTLFPDPPAAPPQPVEDTEHG